MNIFTDGACKENSRENGVALGQGGWAYVALKQIPGKDMEVVLSGSGSKEGSTNQEMEITAVACAFEEVENSKIIIEEDEKITLYSDSAYVINCLKDKWYSKWINNGWLNSKKKPVENRDAWERLLVALNRLAISYEVEFYHVKRNSTKFIKKVDGMAKSASKIGTSQEQ